MPSSSSPVSVLELAFRMGETLLENGAEISRVQETMERIAQAYHVEAFNVYVLTNAIFASGVEDGIQHSVKMQYIPSTSTHLGRISAVNQLSREIVQGDRQVAEAFARLEEIRVLPYSRLPAAELCQPSEDEQVFEQSLCQRSGHPVRVRHVFAGIWG